MSWKVYLHFASDQCVLFEILRVFVGILRPRIPFGPADRPGLSFKLHMGWDLHVMNYMNKKMKIPLVNDTVSQWSECESQLFSQHWGYQGMVLFFYPCWLRWQLKLFLTRLFFGSVQAVATVFTSGTLMLPVLHLTVASLSHTHNHKLLHKHKKGDVAQWNIF